MVNLQQSIFVDILRLELKLANGAISYTVTPFLIIMSFVSTFHKYTHFCGPGGNRTLVRQLSLIAFYMFSVISNTGLTTTWFKSKNLGLVCTLFFLAVRLSNSKLLI